MSYLSEADALEDTLAEPKARSKRGAHKKGAATAAQVPAAGHPHIMPDRIWLVLARRTYDEPLRQVGTVEADDSELARVYASSIYDEFAWIEMAVVPRDALITVIEA